MKFKEKSNRFPKKKKSETRARSTPFKIKVVDIEDKKTVEQDEEVSKVETEPAKKNGYVKKVRKANQQALYQFKFSRAFFAAHIDINQNNTLYYAIA